jgi:anti-sigma B factor antagonist
MANPFTASEPGAQDSLAAPGGDPVGRSRSCPEASTALASWRQGPSVALAADSGLAGRQAACVTDTVTDNGPGLSVSVDAERGCVIAALIGELDITRAPALREQLFALLRPSTGRLVIDVSRVTYADASGLAVLVGTGRRAGLLGKFLRLAAPAPAVAKVLRVTGLDRQLDVFPTVQAAITSPE